MNSKLPKIYLIILILYSIIMGLNPLDRYMWFVENFIMFVFVGIMILTYRKFRFSNVSYTMMFLFLLLQITGAHYTYAEVPFEWFTSFFGFERNHFDRVVHFSFGLLFAFPFRELVLRTSNLRGKFWSYYFPVEMAFGIGAVYEVIEWIFASLSNPDAGIAFLGAQGDIWDAQIDMFLAGVGAAIMMVFTGIFGKVKKA